MVVSGNSPKIFEDDLFIHFGQIDRYMYEGFSCDGKLSFQGNIS